MTIAIDVLLSLAVCSEAICVAGVLVGATVFDRLHYAGAATTLPPTLVLAAVVVREGAKAPSWNAGLVAVALLLLNSVSTHVTGRVARDRAL